MFAGDAGTAPASAAYWFMVEVRINAMQNSPVPPNIAQHDDRDLRAWIRTDLDRRHRIPDGELPDELQALLERFEA